MDKPRVLYSGGSSVFPSASTSAPVLPVSGCSSSWSQSGQGPRAMGSLPCGALSPQLGQASALPQPPHRLPLRPQLLSTPPRPLPPSALRPGPGPEPWAPGPCGGACRPVALRGSSRLSPTTLTCRERGGIWWPIIKRLVGRGRPVGGSRWRAGNTSPCASYQLTEAGSLGPGGAGRHLNRLLRAIWGEAA